MDILNSNVTKAVLIFSFLIFFTSQGTLPIMAELRGQSTGIFLAVMLTYQALKDWRN